MRRTMAVLLALLALAASHALAQDAETHVPPHGAEAHGEHVGDIADLGHGNVAEGLENPSEWRSELAIYTFIVFALLLLILLKFAWGPISQALEQREQNIAGHIAAAEAKHEEAKQLLADYERKLAGAADQVRELLEEARRDAEHTKAEILSEAKAAAQAEHDRAMRDVRNATDAALKQLAETSANLAVDLAGRIVQQRMTPEEETRLIREALAKLPNGAPSTN